MTDSRINMRISASDHEELKAAAQLAKQDLTSFMIYASLEKAEKLVAESNVFKLSAKEVLAIEKALAETPEFNPELNKLLNLGKAPNDTK